MIIKKVKGLKEEVGEKQSDQKKNDGKLSSYACLLFAVCCLLFIITPFLHFVNPNSLKILKNLAFILLYL